MIIQSIQSITKEQISRFDCGVNELNDYLKKYAAQNDKKNMGKSFVGVDDGRVTGYYTLSNAQVAFEEIDEDMRKGLPKYPIPAIRIARLAVNKNHQGEGVGRLLLKDAFLRILNVSVNTGIYFVIVDAKDSAKSFYEHYGFRALSDGKTYIIPVRTILKALS